MKIITFLDVTPCRLVNSCFISGFRHGVKDLRCSGMLRSVDSYFVTDILGQPIGPIVSGLAA